MTTPFSIMSRFAENPKTHGETIVHNPTAAFIQLIQVWRNKER